MKRNLGARHLKRAIEKHVVSPLANLVATAQVRIGDFVRIDLGPEGCMTFVKEAESASTRMLLEPQAAKPSAATRTIRCGGESAPVRCVLTLRDEITLQFFSDRCCPR